MADTDLFLGKAEEAQFLLLDRANRHGVVAGATGTGKTVTLQIMAQGFSDAGDDPVAVGAVQQEELRLFGLAQEQVGVGHEAVSCVSMADC